MLLSAKQNFLLVLALILISRLPFINAGYGAEEDAWAMRLVTERIATTGQYEVSRLPGHPLQELTYTLIWKHGAIAFNLLTVLLSTAGIAFFMLSLRKLQIKNYLQAGIALAFVPAVFINSTNALDYTWAFAFLMMSFYFLIYNNYWIAGIFIGLAVGCRITSGAMLIPYIYLTWCFSQNVDKNPLRVSVMPNLFRHLYSAQNRQMPKQVRQDDNQALKNIFKLTTTTILFSLLLFLPVINVYGINFFQYYEHFPIPSFAKNFYKGSFAVWGAIGFIAVITTIIYCLPSYRKKNKFIDENPLSKSLIITSIVAIVIYLIAFIKLPLKSAFMIPMIPFIILIFVLMLSQKQFSCFMIIMLASSFFFGINLSDAYRASAPSPLSFTTTISNQNVSFDLLQGPVIADYLKRKQQIFYADEVIKKNATITNKTVVIAGWWLANILVQQESKANAFVIYRYYLPESELKFYHLNNYQIFFLPQQDEFNDLRFGGKFTKQYAALLNI